MINCSLILQLCLILENLNGFVEKSGRRSDIERVQRRERPKRSQYFETAQKKRVLALTTSKMDEMRV
jgi:hypothetical protein